MLENNHVGISSRFLKLIEMNFARDCSIFGSFELMIILKLVHFSE